jgi:hypothetical protein
MSDARTTNLLGAAVTALNDELEAATASAAEHGAAFPAALVSVHWAPGLSIEQLRRILGLSHSGTVRLLDRLEREGAVERKAGRDAHSVAVHLTAQGRRHVRTILDRRRPVRASWKPGRGYSFRLNFLFLGTSRPWTPTPPHSPSALLGWLR